MPLPGVTNIALLVLANDIQPLFQRFHLTGLISRNVKSKHSQNRKKSLPWGKRIH